MNAKLTIEQDGTVYMNDMKTRSIAQDCKTGAPILCLPDHRRTRPAKIFIDLAAMEAVDPMARSVQPYEADTKVTVELEA